MDLQEATTLSEPSPILSSAVNDPPTHLDELIGLDPPAAPALPQNMMGKDEFHTMFVGGFKAGYLFTKLESLNIGPDREASAQACSHALYDSILDCPSLHFMLEPRNKWWGRIIAIGTFTIPMAIGIKEDLQARRTAAIAATKPANFTAAKAATAPAFTPEQEALMAAANAQGAT